MPQIKRKAFASISAASEHGDRHDELLAIRRKLAQVLDDEKTGARDIASVSRRLIDVSKEIAALEAEESAGTAPEVNHSNVVGAQFRPEAI